MIYLYRIIFPLLFLSLSFSDFNVQFSQQSNIANGIQIRPAFPVTSDFPDTSAYRIHENIIDLGVGYKKLYLYSQFEYSEEPFLGEINTELTSSVIKPENMLNSYYLQYITDKFSIKAGDIYSQYTRGLIFNTYQDQSIDFDNSIFGLELKYSVLDWLKVYSVYGNGNFEFRTNPIIQRNELSHEHTSTFLGTEISPISDFIFNFQYMKQELFIDEHASNTLSFPN